MEEEGQEEVEEKKRKKKREKKKKGDDKCFTVVLYFCGPGPLLSFSTVDRGGRGCQGTQSSHRDTLYTFRPNVHRPAG